jgi:L-seryl-tRNA(Ser) seleniumtransferase
MPEQNLASYAVALSSTLKTISRVEKELRQLEVPVVGRIEEERLILDMRTVLSDETELLARCLKEVLGSGPVN